MSKLVGCWPFGLLILLFGCVQQPIAGSSAKKLVASNIQSADVDFEMETGSFLLKYVMKDGTKCAIVLECPKAPESPTDKAPRVVLREDSNVVGQQVISEQEFQSFVRARLRSNDVSNEEAGFIAVTVLSTQRIADIQGWGFSSASIMNGEWQKVFRKPESGLRGPSRQK